MESNANYSMSGKDIVPINQLTEMKAGEAYFKIFGTLLTTGILLL